ncbi:MAG: hypothetical protein R3185_09650 [Candidatus Thermoplasmatota archaeon]|nr:hypothetical protein [Candidatus Thermoplasmatota archaeon]
MSYEGCCGPQVHRRYYNRQEKIEWLSAYAEALENELAGVKERIEALEEA